MRSHLAPHEPDPSPWTHSSDTKFYLIYFEEKCVQVYGPRLLKIACSYLKFLVIKIKIHSGKRTTLGKMSFHFVQLHPCTYTHFNILKVLLIRLKSVILLLLTFDISVRFFFIASFFLFPKNGIFIVIWIWKAHPPEPITSSLVHNIFLHVRQDITAPIFRKASIQGHYRSRPGLHRSTFMQNVDSDMLIWSWFASSKFMAHFCYAHTRTLPSCQV